MLDPSQFMDADEDSTDDDSSAHSLISSWIFEVRDSESTTISGAIWTFSECKHSSATAVMLDPSEYLDADEDAAAAPRDE